MASENESAIRRAVSQIAYPPYPYLKTVEFIPKEILFDCPGGKPVQLEAADLEYVVEGELSTAPRGYPDSAVALNDSDFTNRGIREISLIDSSEGKPQEEIITEIVYKACEHAGCQNGANCLKKRLEATQDK